MSAYVFGQLTGGVVVAALLIAGWKRVNPLVIAIISISATVLMATLTDMTDFMSALIGLFCFFWYGAGRLAITIFVKLRR